MTLQELEAVRGLLRELDLDLAGPPEVARASFEEMLSHVPVPEEISFEPIAVGGVPTLLAEDPEVRSHGTLLYLHGGGFAAGSANGYRGLWSALARAAGVRGLAVDYRLAPEHPFPVAVEDALAAYRGLLDEGHSPERIALAGDSAGGGLVVSLLVAARDAGLPLPRRAVCLSPWADLTCAGASYREKAGEDLSLDGAELATLATRYAGDRIGHGLASPVRADLSGLPPLLVQVGSAEILLDDAISLARRAGAAGVQTTLEIWPGMPHVWHSFGFMLGEGAAATARAAAFISRWTGEE